MAASKSTADTDGKSTAAETAEVKSEDDGASTPQCPKEGGPTSTSSSLLGKGRALISLLLFVALGMGTVLGGYLTAHILETEYQDIVAKLQSDHHIALVRSQSDYLDCHAKLSEETQSKEVDTMKLRIHADRNERAFQKRAEQYLNEINMAYTLANEGLDKASSRLKEEVGKTENKQRLLFTANTRLQSVTNDHKHAREELSEANERLQSTIGELSAANNRLQSTIEVHGSTEAELSQTKKRLSNMLKVLGESSRELEVAQEQRNETLQRLVEAEHELDSAADELEVQRIECDEYHRNMLQCQDSLQGALVDLAEAHRQAGLDGEGTSNDLAEKSVMLAQVSVKYDRLTNQMQIWQDEQGNLEQKSFDLEEKLEDAERWREHWERKAKVMMEKIMYRNRKDVLEKYGPGPHRVRLNLKFESEPRHESVILQLAPLDMMPHTIHTFLYMMENSLYRGGAFIVAREHIVVGGPIDPYNDEDNAVVEKVQLHEGFFPNGALLFKEYSPDYPHAKYTIGFNQMGGPVFYINLRDNDKMHGPGEGDMEEGDPCFARVVDGWGAVQRIAVLGTEDGSSLYSPVYITGSEVVNITA